MIAVKDFSAKKFARYNWVLIVTKLDVSGTSVFADAEHKATEFGRRDIRGGCGDRQTIRHNQNHVGRWEYNVKQINESQYVLDDSMYNWCSCV